MATSLTSRAWIFLPRYSGVRPTIRPARNTVSSTVSSMPYRPEPTPPKITSPVIIIVSGVIEPRPL